VSWSLALGVRSDGRLRGFLGVDGALLTNLGVLEILVPLSEDIIDSSMIRVVFEALGLALEVDEAVERAYDGGAIAKTKCLRATI
jgi:hypothetical protein